MNYVRVMFRAVTMSDLLLSYSTISLASNAS